MVDDIVWLKQFTGRGLRNATIESGTDNTVFLAGVFDDCETCQLIWESDTLVFGGGEKDDIILAKFDNEGNLLFLKRFGDPDSDEGIAGLAVTSQNEILVLVQNSSTFAVLDSIIPSGHNILKFNSIGELLWSKSIKGSYHNRIGGLPQVFYEQFQLDQNDDIVVAGKIGRTFDYDIVTDTIYTGNDTLYAYLQVSDTLQINSQTYTAVRNNFFLSKFDNNGNLLWVNLYTHEDLMLTRSIICDSLNNIYSIGFFRASDLSIGDSILHVDTSGTISNNLFLTKHESSGNLTWATNHPINVYPTSLSINSTGELIASCDMYTGSYTTNETLQISLSNPIVLLKISPSGEVNWNYNSGLIGYAVLNRSNSLNDIFLSGYYPWPDPTIIKLSDEGLVIDEIEPIGGNRNGLDICFDNSGHLIHLLNYNGNASIGTVELDSAGGAWNIVILKVANQNPTVGLNEVNPLRNGGITLFPNPTNSFLHIRLEEPFDMTDALTIISANGIVQKNKPAKRLDENTCLLDISELKAGLYVVCIEQNDETHCLNFVIEN